MPGPLPKKPHVPYRPGEYIQLFAAPPHGVQQALRTLPGGAEDILTKAEDCIRQLHTMIVAAKEERLLLQERQNLSSGEVGLLVCESWKPQVPEEVSLIAELLEVPGGTWEDQTLCFQRLERLAIQNELAVVAHGLGTRITPFIARMEEHDGSVRIAYLARMLRSAGELAQWRLE